MTNRKTEIETAASAARLADSGASRTQLTWKALEVWTDDAWGRGEEPLPLTGDPLTGKPDAGDPPVRFGGRGGGHPLSLPLSVN